MRPRLLYIGNKLSNYGYNETGVEFLGNELEKRGYKIIYAGTYLNKVSRLFEMIGKIILFRNRVDLILIDVYSTKAYYYAVICAWVSLKFSRPYILILHGGNLPKRKVDSYSSCKNMITKAKHTVSPSRYLQAEFNEFDSDIYFIPNSIDIANYQFSPVKSVQPLNILWVRAFHEIYNPELAIRAIYKLNQHNIRSKLCMVGPDKDGSLKRCKDLATSLAIDDQLTFTGKLSKEDWIKLAAKFNIFLNTSNFDNFPVSILEAMALGKIIVSTDAGGIPYLIEDKKDGFLFDIGDEEQLVATLAKLSNMPVKDLEEVQDYARVKVETFDTNIVLDQWEELLNSIDL